MGKSDATPFVTLLSWLDRFPKLRIGVLGDFAADHYLIGKTSRISREAPVLILKKLEDSIRPGQAGNSAANLAALGIRCRAFGFVGADPEGKRLTRVLSELGVEPSGIVVASRGRSVVKTRVLSGAHHTNLQQVIRLDDDEGLAIGKSERAELLSMLRAALPKLNAMLVSDYGYGALDAEAWKLIQKERARRWFPVVLDSRYALAEFTGADVITPNETEVFSHLGIERFSGADPVKAGRGLIAKTRCKGLLMTRGNEGMLVFEGKGKPLEIPIFGSDEVTDVTGAGDTVAATATGMIAAGATLAEAARLANIAAGLKVMKRGAATVSADEIRRAVKREG